MPKDVARVLQRLRWGVFIAALVALFVLRMPQLALVLAILGLFLGVLGRQAWFQQLVAQLIGRQATVQTKPSPTAAPEETVLTEAEIAALLDKEAQPAIFLKRQWPIDPVSEANSYLGGLPKLPDDMAWPENPETGFALHHLAQIDLSEMPRIDADPNLPQAGMLWFFADINENMDWEQGPGSPESCVLYAPRQHQRIAAAARPEKPAAGGSSRRHPSELFMVFSSAPNQSVPALARHRPANPILAVGRRAGRSGLAQQLCRSPL